MISLNNWATQAHKKLSEESKAVSGQKEKAMSSAVLAVIKDFCTQDAEFAQAVVQGGSFADCMKAVAKDVCNSISDLDAYRKAVQFYFPGAKVQMQMTIDLIGDAAGEPETVAEVEETAQTEKKATGMVLDLSDFF